MPPTNPQASLPLEQRIGDVERRLLERRRSASAHLATAKRCVHAGLTSPVTLLLALGVGVALGQFVSRRRTASPAPVREPREAPGAGVAAMLLDVLSIAAPVAAMLSALGKANPRSATRGRDGAHDTA